MRGILEVFDTIARLGTCDPRIGRITEVSRAAKTSNAVFCGLQNIYIYMYTYTNHTHIQTYIYMYQVHVGSEAPGAHPGPQRFAQVVDPYEALRRIPRECPARPGTKGAGRGPR